MKTNFPCALAIACLWDATLVGPATAVTSPPGNLTAVKSGSDLVLSFSTTATNFYGVQRAPDLLLPWTNVQSGIQGDGTVKQLTITNAFSAGRGFYQLYIQPRPTALLLPQSTAFAILGHWCGGIHEQVFVTGFDLTKGNPTGNVDLSTTCSTGGRGAPSATFKASASVIWDFAGNVVSATTPATGPASSPTFSATDLYGDIIYNTGAAAYLLVPVPKAPVGVAAEQSGDQFQISWSPNGVNPAAITSSTLTATPVNSTASILTTTVAGSGTNGVIASLQPQTEYLVTIVNTTIGGSGPASIPIRVTTAPASMPPSAPAALAASWMNPDPTGATDTLVATWQAAVPGDSPIDQYQITIVGSEGAGTFIQTVSGTALSATFTVNYIPTWSVTVQAHNAFGWGPLSTAVTLGGL